MASYTDPRTGEPIRDDVARQPVKPPPGELGDRIVPPPVARAAPSVTSVIVGVLALIAIVFVFMSMNWGPAPPPPAPATPPGQTTVQ